MANIAEKNLHEIKKRGGGGCRSTFRACDTKSVSAYPSFRSLTSLALMSSSLYTSLMVAIMNTFYFKSSRIWNNDILHCPTFKSNKNILKFRLCSYQTTGDMIHARVFQTVYSFSFVISSALQNSRKFPIFHSQWHAIPQKLIKCFMCWNVKLLLPCEQSLISRCFLELG